MMGDRLLFCVLVLLLAIGCMGGEQTAPTKSGGQVISTDEAKSLFEGKCSRIMCHSLSRPASEKKSYNEWMSTVHRMIGYGATVSDDEAEIIAVYLAKTYGKE